MRKTGSRGILSDMDLSAAGFVFQSKNLVVLQHVRRINNDLAARLNIFQNRDHLVFRDRNASAGRTVCTAVQEMAEPTPGVQLGL